MLFICATGAPLPSFVSSRFESISQLGKAPTDLHLVVRGVDGIKEGLAKFHAQQTICRLSLSNVILLIELQQGRSLRSAGFKHWIAVCARQCAKQFRFRFTQLGQPRGIQCSK